MLKKLLLSFKNKNSYTFRSFTIIELLVVIVVIGILAAVIVVSYTGITQRAVAVSQQSDLSNASKTLELYYVEHDSVYPSTMTDDGNGNYCPTPEDTKYCVKASGDNTLTYDASSPYDTYTLIASNPNATNDYQIVPGGVPTVATPAPSGPETVTIGTQTWMKYNINEGTMVNASATPQTLAQKWCYDNLESNCTTYGGLYQWNTAMQGSTAEGVQGICPTGFHVPTKAEWTTLASSEYGTQLKVGESSGFDSKLGGSYSTSFSTIDGFGFYITSTQSDATKEWVRAMIVDPGSGTMEFSSSKTTGYSIRCIRD